MIYQGMTAPHASPCPAAPLLCSNRSTLLGVSWQVGGWVSSCCIGLEGASGALWDVGGAVGL